MLTGIFGELSQDHAAALVARLRAVRRQRRLTLLQVEHQSAGRFNAIVVAPTTAATGRPPCPSPSIGGRTPRVRSASARRVA